MSYDKTEIIFIENQNRQSRLANLEELLRHKFIIPSFQRLYAWEKENLEDLLSTIKNNKEEDRDSFFGSVIVSAIGKDDQQVCLIDGQQRITSFLLITRFIKDYFDNEMKKIDNRIAEIEKLKEKAKKNGDLATHSKLEKEQWDKENQQEKYEASLKKLEQILKERITREKSNNTDPSPDNHQEQSILTYLNKLTTKPDKIIKNLKARFDNWIEEESQNVEDIKSYLYNDCIFCFLKIVGENAEDYAIDIFNSLNSTGEPLTPFEIMKSTVHQHPKDNTNSNKTTTYLNKIETELKQSGVMKRNSQKKYTDRLILFMNMLHSNLQRPTLTKFRDYKELIDELVKFETNELIEFFKKMYDMHRFTMENWENKRQIKLNISEKAKVYLTFLKDLNHDRTLPVIYHFKGSKEAIESCLAFTLLWRGYANGGGTDGIDQQYQILINNLHSIGNDTSKLKQEFCTLLGKRDGTPNLDKSTWINKFIQNEITNSKKLARFMIFLIHNKSNSNFLTLENYTSKTLAKLTTPKDQNGQIIKHLGGPKLTAKDSTDIREMLAEEAEQRCKKMANTLWDILAKDILGWTD